MAGQTASQTGAQKRQPAYKVIAKEIIDGKYIKEEGWNPNYIEVGDGRRISRINLIATVVQKSVSENSNYGGIILDDGSSRISARSFENLKIFDSVSVGDVVLAVGKPREFGNEKYILAEIVKKVNPVWMKARKLELGEKSVLPLQKPEERFENTHIGHAKPKESLPEKIFRLVKEKDTGSGADIDEIISASETADAEKLIKALLENGDLFEIRAGKLKVLE